MEQEEVSTEANHNKCISCGSSFLTEGKTPLCHECREHFIHFPIPNGIKIAAGVILLVILYSLFSLFTKMDSTLCLLRGKRAESRKEFISAGRYLDQFLKKNPHHIEGNAYLLIASYYNSDAKDLGKAYSELENRNIEDAFLVARLQDVLERYSINFKSDSLNAFMQGVKDTVLSQEILVKYLEKNPADLSATYALAALYIEDSIYTRAEEMLDSLYNEHPKSVEIYSGLISAKRYVGKYEEALKLCDNIIKYDNKEDVSALSQKVRILIVTHKEQEALRLAKNTLKIKPDDTYALTTLALAYHFNQNTIERDKTMKLLEVKTKKSEEDLVYINAAKDIINGKKKLI